MTDAAAPKNEFPWLKKYPVDIDWNAEIPQTTLTSIFEDSVKKNAEKPCLNFIGKTLTYKEVGAMVDRFAKGLQDQGIGKGSKIGLCLPNTPFYVISYYGALKAGATVVNFNPLYGEKELEHQINDSGTDIMVTVNVNQVQPKVEALLGKTNLKKIVSCDLADALPSFKGFAYRTMNAVKRIFGNADTVKTKFDSTKLSFTKMLKSKGAPAPVDVQPNDIAVLQYTGGTTGVPKGAALSHGNLTANLAQANLWFTGGKDAPEKEKVLVILPFFHVFSMTVQMNLSLSRGAEIVMLPKFDLKQTLQTITKEKPTMFAGVPTLYKAIIDCKTIGQYDLSSLKICLSGGAPLNEPIMQGFKKLTGLELVEGYGLSETSPLAVANPLHGTKKINSVGLPVPQTEVKIVQLPDADTKVTVEGEICLRGPQVMKGYWNRQDETDKVIDKEGFFHTGDVGYLDEDGYLFIVDRIKDMINDHGMKIFSRKVEEAILKHPDISEAVVIGIADDRRGEIAKAFLVMKEGKAPINKTDLNAFLKDHLAPYEFPRLVDVRDALPKTVIGKPDKKPLIAEEKEKAAAKAKGPKPPTP